MPREPYSPRTIAEIDTTPFDSAEEAWFWFIAAQKARNDGARVIAGQGLTPRPCEPTDILKAVDRLYRNRRLSMDHILVLRHYGVRFLPPEPARVREARASMLWDEAMERLGDALSARGIVQASSSQQWLFGAMEAAE
jgi:hypothetical protein